MSKRHWSPAADLVVKNAKIYTVDLTIDEIKAGKNDFTVIENGYVAAKDGKTISVGAGDPASTLIDADTEIIDAKGKTLIPGLIDCHMHAMWAGIELMAVNQKTCENKQDFIERLRKRAAETPKGE